MKKSLKAIALAAVLVAMPVTAFAAGSGSAGNTSFDSGVSHDNGGSSSSSSSSTSTSAAATTDAAKTETIVTASGAKVTVEGATTNSSGVKSGMVSTGSGATAATGAAATAGLPADVVSTINAINGGDLSNVPGVDLSGKSAYGSTVAVRAEAGNLTASIYVSKLPANGVVQVLFYNNNGGWSLIEATVDPATNTVTFTAPYSGTALVVG